MASALLALLGLISDLFTVVGGFQSLFPSGSQNVITLQDFGRLLRQENLSFFTQVEYGRLQSTRLNFYEVWLPAIASRTVIDVSDIDPTSGALHHVFRNLADAIQDVHMRVETLASVFRQNIAVLHSDDFMQGMFLMMEVYGLLLHMHVVWATLRRIQVGASSLDDPDLIVDTLSAMVYTSSARTFVREMRELSWTRRSDAIQPISILGGIPGWEGGIRIFYFSDIYSPLPNTLRPLTIDLSPIRLYASYRRSTLEDSNAATWIANARDNHERAMRVVFNSKTWEPLGFVTEMDNLMAVLEARLALQSRARGLDNVHGVRDLYNSEEEAKEAMMAIYHKHDDKEATIV
ncbi:hypothetical protein BDP27DRAFT_1364337 [Rhodocollybia butyracea]|uniref:Uncharacterized protein n=1 Tax=Rhodocollybia butyracea TaxID=206335 RepID=A0A9P5U6W3_9AGAR|nr:hypothetical protein BDP27DRAFT_1364337 [Rhodocollybia butyracea]